MSTLPVPSHPNLVATLIDELAQAAMVGTKELQARYRRSRRPAHVPCRQPGKTTPMWNNLVENLRIELAQRGTQARLARYMGLPRQRIHDFLKSNSRMPDAETTLRLFHWLLERRSGRDPSL
ncbi:MAG: helix-turn-helix transcriptional regulator [Opitutaceae bacterium]|jgi:hypothetical protein|nr:helix-turn-helix transcriptional regulator [Opitutaceae bacterium]